MSETHRRSKALKWLRLAAMLALALTPLRSFATLALGSCDTFDSTTGWTSNVAGRFGVSAATYNSASSSLYTRGGAVAVTSGTIDLSGVQTARLSIWIRRGGAFSDQPEAADTLQLQYQDGNGTYQLLEEFVGGGTAGQIFTRNYLLPTAALTSNFKLRFLQVNGETNLDYWHIDDACLLNGMISYQFEEPSWNGTAGQVKDSGSNGLNGTSGLAATTANSSPSPPLANNPGTCRYGQFDGNSYVTIADAPALNILNELTVTTWIYPKSTPSDLQTILSKDTNYEFHLNSSRQIFWWWNQATLTTTGAAMVLNTWHHVAITYKSGTQKIYIDGVERASGTATGTLPQNTDLLYIATDLAFHPSRDFNGNIDEIRIIPKYLSQSEITTIMNETHPCVNSAKFTINHDGFGINCVAKSITVNVVDATAGTPLTSYNAQVQLDTQTGSGTWAKTSGSGTFSDGTANDGIATYNWPLGESTATFTLYYPSGTQAMDVDVFQVSDTGIRDTDAEGPLTFYPSGFTVTAAALSNPPPGAITTFATNQTAGTTFNVYLAAYGQTPNDATCGVIEAYTGAKNLKFWSTYVSPTTGTRNVTIDTVSAATVEASATAQSVTFTNGQAVVQAKYKDVGRLKIAMKDDTVTNASQLPTGIRGGTANFVAKPASFALTSITNSSSVVNPGASSAAGTVFTSAGTPFNITLTVRDAEGTTTPNYGRETSPETETVKLAVSLVAPAGGSAPALSPGAFSSFTNGVATDSFSWPEVGIIQLAADVGDADYLTAGDVTTTSGNIGRFIPARFDVALNTPLLAPSCSPDIQNGFSYQGQTFAYKATSPVSTPVITATAKSATGSTTQNYTSSVSPSFFKLASSTLTGNYSSLGSAGTLQLNGALTPLTSAPAVAASAPGVATLSFATANFGFRRTTAAAPFAAGLQLAINVTDSDGVAAVGTAPLANPVTFGYGSGMGFDSTNFPYGEIRYGRIRLANALGSERIDLPMKMVSEYYAGSSTGFLQNTLDTCSTNGSLALSNPTENLAVNETCVRDSGSPGSSGIGCSAVAAAGIRFAEPPVGGDFNLRLAAPGVGNQGSVLVTATVPTWLRFDWNSATSGDENPTGEASFGVFTGESRQIYTREIY